MMKDIPNPRNSRQNDAERLKTEPTSRWREVEDLKEIYKTRVYEISKGDTHVSWNQVPVTYMDSFSMRIKTKKSFSEEYYFPKLERLSIYGGDKIPGTFISRQKELKVLTVIQTGATKIPDLSSLANLEKLDFTDNAISKISGVGNLKNLVDVTFMRNKIHSLEGLAGLTSLKKLGLTGNEVQDLNGFKDLVSLENLEVIYLENNKVKDLNVYSKVPKLSKIHLGGNEITRITAVENLPNLERLTLYNNTLVEFDGNAFKNVPKLELIDLSGNSSLKKLRGIENLPEGTEIIMPLAINFSKNEFESIKEYVESVGGRILDTGFDPDFDSDTFSIITDESK